MIVVHVVIAITRLRRSSVVVDTYRFTSCIDCNTARTPHERRYNTNQRDDEDMEQELLKGYVKSVYKGVKEQGLAGESGDNTNEDNDENERKQYHYRGWAMMHTLKAGGNTVEQILKDVGYLMWNKKREGNEHSHIERGTIVDEGDSTSLAPEGYVYFEDGVADRARYHELLHQYYNISARTTANSTTQSPFSGGYGVPFLPALPRDEFFTIGQVREPCDYMVSIWAFSGMVGHNHHGNLTGRCAGNESIANFTRFLHESTTPHFGWLTYRLALQLDGGAATAPGGARAGTTTCIPDVDNETVSRLKAQMEQFDAAKAADCWVRTENLLGDLRRCLKLYAERRGGNTSMSMDKLSLREEVPLRNRNSRRESCLSYYTEEEAQYVWDREGRVAEQFGYRGCCQSLDEPILPI